MSIVYASQLPPEEPYSSSEGDPEVALEEQLYNAKLQILFLGLCVLVCFAATSLEKWRNQKLLAPTPNCIEDHARPSDTSEDSVISTGLSSMPESVGWDKEFLEKNRKERQYNGSVEDLKKSPLFVEFTRGKIQGYVRREETKLSLLQQIRRQMPSALAAMMNTTEMWDYDTVSPAPLLLVVLDYLVWLLSTSALIHNWRGSLGSSPLGLALSLAHIIAQLYLWSNSYASIFGWSKEVYLVEGKDEELRPAGFIRMLVAGCLETTGLYFTHGLSGVAGLLYKCINKRQSMSEYLVGIRPVQEVRRSLVYAGALQEAEAQGVY